jgi:hypothetical protein
MNSASCNGAKTVTFPSVAFKKGSECNFFFLAAMIRAAESEAVPE